MASLDWLPLLGCPREPERPSLTYAKEPGDAGSEWLVCTVCGYGYKIESGIPNLLPEEAVNPDELAKLGIPPKGE